MLDMLHLVIGLLLSLSRERQALVAENLLLRHQLMVALRSRPRPRVRRQDRLRWVLARRPPTSTQIIRIGRCG